MATVAIISAIVSVGSAIYAATLSPDTPDDIGASVTKQGSTAPRNRVYGKCRVSCSNVYSNVVNNSNDWRLDIFQAAGVGKLKYIHQAWIDDKQLLNVDQNLVTDPLLANQGLFEGNDLSTNFRDQSIKVQFRNGSRVERAMELAYNYTSSTFPSGKDFSDGEWTADHRGDSVPQVAVVARRVTDKDGVVITGSTYNIIIEATGGDVDDGLGGTTSSDNPAYALLDYLTNTEYGLHIPSAYINIQSFIDAATWCDLSSGNKPKLTINAETNSDASFSDNILDILSTMGGSLYFENGLITLGYEYIESPIYTITPDDILKDTFSVRPVSSENRYNCVTTSFKSGANDEQEDSFILPVDVVNNQEILRAGELIPQDIEMPFTIDGRLDGSGELIVDGAVKYFTNQEYEKRNWQQTCTLDIDLSVYPNLSIWSVVELVNPIYWTGNKEFRVLSMTSSTNDERYNIATVEFVEYSDSVYQQTEDGNGGTKPLQPPSRPTAPTALSFIQETWVTDGYGTLSWVPTFYSHSIRYDVEYKLSSSADWVTLSTIETEFYKISGLKSADYDFRVRVNDYILGTSTWVAIINQSISPPIIIPPVQNLTADFSTMDCIFNWDDALNYPLGGTDPTNPDSGGGSGTVRDIFSNYKVDIFESTTSGSGFTLAKTFAPTDNTFTYTLGDNETSGNGIRRHLRAFVSIVSKTGSESTTLVQIDISNGQMGLPIDNGGNLGFVSVTDINAFTKLEWQDRQEVDFKGTEIHVSDSSSFTPDNTTLVTTLSSESFYMYSFPVADEADKYVRVGHFDVFGKNRSVMQFSPAQKMTYNPAESAVTFSIRSTAQAFKFDANGNLGTPSQITFEANKQNIDDSVSWTTTPNVGSGAGDSFVLTGAQFGTNQSVVVNATMATNTHGTFRDQITVVRLQDGSAGAGSFTLENVANTIIGSNSVECVGGTSGVYDASANAVEFFGDEFSFSGRFTQSAGGAMIFGARKLITGGGTPSNFSYSIERDAANIVRVYESGSLVSTHPAATNSDVFSVSRISNNISYRKNGEEFENTVIVSTSDAFTFGVAFQNNGDKLDAITISTGLAGGDGENAISVSLSNESHSIPTDSNGANGIYAESGTIIRAFDGTTELDYDGSGATNGTYKVTANASNITVGSITDNGNSAIVADSSAMTSGIVIQTATIDFTVTGTNLKGAPFNITRRQSISKAVGGVEGGKGDDGANGKIVRAFWNLSETQPNKPTGTNLNSVGVGWSETSPAVIPLGFKVWSSSTYADDESTSTGSGYWTDVGVLSGSDGNAAFTLKETENVILTPTSVTKDIASTAWNAGAYSEESWSGPCFVSMKSTQSNTMFGLSDDDGTSSSYATINYAIYLKSNGDVNIYESNVSVGKRTTANETDLLAVFNYGDRVEYKKNGTTFYTSAVTPTSTYRFDCSLSGIDSVLSNITMGALGEKGTDGLTLRAVFRNSASKPTIPTGTTIPPSGWTLSPSSPPSGQYTWQSYTYAENATTSTGNGDWTPVIRASGNDGTDGGQGDRGAGQFTVPDYAGSWDSRFGDGVTYNTNTIAMATACNAATTAGLATADDAITIFGDDPVNEPPISVRFTGGTPTDPRNYNLYENVIHGDQLVEGTVTADRLVANTITAQQIKANTITAAEIKANTITAAEITAGTITAAEIKAGTITGTQISATATIIAGSGTNTAGMNGLDSGIYNTWRFWSGSSTPSSANFRVNRDGKLFADDAEITGTVKIGSGSPTDAGIHITEELLTVHDGTRYRVRLGRLS